MTQRTKKCCKNKQKIKELPNVLPESADQQIIKISILSKFDHNTQIKHNRQSKHQDQTMIKIYYLKDNIQANNLQFKAGLEKKPHVRKMKNNQIDLRKNKPSLPCLSSFIQCDKNTGLDDNQAYLQRGNSLNHVQAHTDGISNRVGKTRDNNSHLKTIPLQQLIGDQQQQYQVSRRCPPRKAITEEINCNKSIRKPQTESIQHQRTKQSPTKHHPLKRRLTETSQQQQLYPMYKKQNNQAHSKDFLCNIVKQWTHFTQSQQLVSKRAKLTTWKSPRADQPRKSLSYRTHQNDQLRKNKSLMQEHFNMFIQSRKNRKSVINNEKKGLSAKMKEVVVNCNNMDYYNSYHSLTKMQSRGDDHSTKNIRRRDNVLNAADESGGVVNRRRLSLMQRRDKKQYLRLMYGPQVKLLPKLFQQSEKGRNFNWTKLDKDMFDSHKRVRFQKET